MTGVDELKEETYVVIAAYHEKEVLSDVFADLRDHGFHNIVVVDDGSSDDTYRVAESADDVIALRHVVNRGQGAALQTGIEYAVEDGAEYVVTFDADGQHRAVDAEHMLDRVGSGEYDVALGSRFLEGAGEVPWHRALLLRGSILVQRVFYGVGLSDAHNGLRVLNREAAKSLNITSDGMEHASQIAEQIVYSDLRYVEVPVDIRYTEYSAEKGHGGFLQALKVFFSMLKRKLLR